MPSPKRLDNHETMRYREYSFQVKSVDESANTVTAYASTINPDRMDEIILPRAFQRRLQNFLRNGVHLWSHNGRELKNIIGKAVDAQVQDKGLLVTFQYAVAENPDAKMAFDLIKGGYLNAYSVGFRPITEVAVKDLDLGQFPELEGVNLNGVWCIYTEVELYEISLCAIPCNRESLVVGRTIEDREDKSMASPGGKSVAKTGAESAKIKAAAEALDNAGDDAEAIEDVAEILAECTAALLRIAAEMEEGEGETEPGAGEEENGKTIASSALAKALADFEAKATPETAEATEKVVKAVKCVTRAMTHCGEGIGHLAAHLATYGMNAPQDAPDDDPDDPDDPQGGDTESGADVEDSMETILSRLT